MSLMHDFYDLFRPMFNEQMKCGAVSQEVRVEIRILILSIVIGVDVDMVVAK